MALHEVVPRTADDSDSTLRNACRRLVEEGMMTQEKWQELVDRMTAADNDPDTIVAHCVMHQLIARKPQT